MQELKNKLVEIREEFLKVYEKLKIEEKLALIKELEQQVAEPDIWKNVEEATAKNQELAKLQEEVQPWELLKTQITDISELLEISDEDMKDEFGEQINAMESELTELKKL